MMTTTTERILTVVPPQALRDAFTACLLSVSKDQFLPVLAAVQIEKTGAELIFRSTDRYRLTRVTITLDDVSKAAPDFVTLIDAADVKRVLTAIPKPVRHETVISVALTIDDGSLVVDTGQAVMRVQPVDGEFPRTEALWPAEAQAIEEIGLDPKYLIDLAKMPGRAKNEPVRFRFNGPGKPMVSEWSDDDVAYKYLLMPARFAG